MGSPMTNKNILLGLSLKRRRDSHYRYRNSHVSRGAARRMVHDRRHRHDGRGRLDELSQVAIEGLQGYFRSHPAPEERLEQARKVIVEDELDVKKPLTPIEITPLIRQKDAPARAVKNEEGVRNEK
jgi:hypothetical protein